MIPTQFVSPSDEPWNAIVEAGNNGTLFHRLDFLSYHGNRFSREEHHLIWEHDGTPAVVMPMSISGANGDKQAMSPYGASYGGPVTRMPLTYQQSTQLVASLLAYLEAMAIGKCRLTLPVAACYAVYDETFRFALLEQGFQCGPRDISSVACLDDRWPMSRLVRRHEAAVNRRAKRALRADVTTVHNASVDDFWPVVEATFAKHGAAPTHTRNEWAWLARQFPNRIFADVAYIQGKPIAGLGLFVLNPRVILIFYICQVPEYRSTQALTLLIQQAMSRSRELGFAWVDFGTSTVSMLARENVFLFKESFGAVGQFRETYTWRRVDGR